MSAIDKLSNILQYYENDESDQPIIAPSSHAPSQSTQPTPLYWLASPSCSSSSSSVYVDNSTNSYHETRPACKHENEENKAKKKTEEPHLVSGLIGMLLSSGVIYVAVRYYHRFQRVKHDQMICRRISRAKWSANNNHNQGSQNVDITHMERDAAVEVMETLKPFQSNRRWSLINITCGTFGLISLTASMFLPCLMPSLSLTGTLLIGTMYISGALRCATWQGQEVENNRKLLHVREMLTRTWNAINTNRNNSHMPPPSAPTWTP